MRESQWECQADFTLRHFLYEELWVVAVRFYPWCCEQKGRSYVSNMENNVLQKSAEYNTYVGRYWAHFKFWKLGCMKKFLDFKQAVTRIELFLHVCFFWYSAYSLYFNVLRDAVSGAQSFAVSHAVHDGRSWQIMAVSHGFMQFPWPFCHGCLLACHSVPCVMLTHCTAGLPLFWSGLCTWHHFHCAWKNWKGHWVLIVWHCGICLVAFVCISVFSWCWTWKNADPSLTVNEANADQHLQTENISNLHR